MIQKNIKSLTVYLCFLSLLSCKSVSPDGIQIVDSRRTDYNIIIPRNPSIEEREAAEFFQKNLSNITRVKMPILTDATPESKHEIILGDSERIGDSGIDQDGVSPDGYAIKTKGEKIYIFSPQAGKGALYAVTDFVSSLGIDRFVPNITLYTVDTMLQVPPIDVSFNPPFEWRSLNNVGADNEEFYKWHKLHNSAADRALWGLWGNQMELVIPAYFNLTGNEPTLKKALCLTDDNLGAAIETGLRSLMNTRKMAIYWPISFRENEMWCTCAGCQAVQAEEGSSAGPLVQLINNLAAKFPDKTIATTLDCTTHEVTKSAIADNVLIIISTKNVNRSIPLANDEYSAVFRENLDGWLTKTNQIMIYDFLADNQAPLNPSYNLKTIQANLNYFRSIGIKMIHLEGSDARGADMGPLKSYLAAKALWDPNTDMDRNTTEFCNMYFGDAGPYLKRYVDLQNEQAEKYGKMITVKDGPTVPVRTHLRPELMDQYNYFFNQAEEVIKGDPELRDRVKLARLPMVFASLEQARVYGTGKKGFFLNINGRWMAVPGLKTLATNFASECDRMGVKYIMNGSKTPEQYERELLKYADQSVNAHKAFDQAPTMRRAPHQNYSGGDLSILTDGLKGDDSHFYGWIGYEGYDFESTLNLKAITPVNTISIRFKNDPANNIFLPKTVTVQGSPDGTSFSNLGSKTLDNLRAKPSTESVTFQINGQNLKSVKINALNQKNVPAGYLNSGQPAWLFVDEIEVN